MYSLVKQCGIILGVALGLSSLVGAVRGLPPESGPNDATQTCAAPELLALDPAKVSVQEAYALAETGAATFVDCRSLAEYQEGHVAGAFSLPAEALTLSPGHLQLLSSTPTVVAYCDEACARSSKVAQHIIDAGFADVRVLEGGMEAWIAAGLPAESGSYPRLGEPAPR